jgi:hypothetical protein
MSIETAVILVGGTSSVTGGTSTGFIIKGDTLNEKRVILDDSSEFIDQTNVVFSIKDPVVNSGAPNGYTQQRSSVKMIRPLGLDNGNRTTNTFQTQVSVDPETSDAEKLALIEEGCQLVYQAALADFWRKQSLA